ncbi:MAG: thiamine-phosphate kinase [Actinomycetota bacterium]|nr:thiamine-phosphate kinase [Actinomycetota bacterium]
MLGGELAAIERIRVILGGVPPAGETWIGDDAAVVGTSGLGEHLLLTSDAVVGGVHADLGLVGLDDFGWKAMAAALSDIAAMGGRPCNALVSVIGPPDTDLALLYRGLSDAALHWACPIVGGDLVSAPLLVVSVSVTGAAPTGLRPVLRSGARAGDYVFVTGPLGSSAAGLARLRCGDLDDIGARLALAHRRPLARVDEGLAAASAGATAMIDVSDGLATDLGHLAQASSVGFDLEWIPVATGADESDALGGGEDYELVFTAPDAEAVMAGFDLCAMRPPLMIGRCSSQRSGRRLRGEQLGRFGWEHEWN